MDLAKTSTALANDLANLQVVREPFIEDFLYARHITMIAADPGAGKSIIATQIALSLSSGTSLFGQLAIPQPRKVYYLQLEGDYIQSIERLRRMQTEVPLNVENLAWDDCRVVNILSPKWHDLMIQRLQTYWTPEVVIIDPLYRLVFAPLANEESGQAIARFTSRLQDAFNCATLLIHHTHRTRYGQDGQQLEEADSYFGSQWIKATLDVSYYLKSTSERRDTCALYCKKFRGGDVLREIFLSYDPETDTCQMAAPTLESSGETRVLHFLSELKKVQKTTDFYEVLEACKLSHAHLRRIQMRLLRSGALRCNKRMGHKKIWEPS